MKSEARNEFSMANFTPSVNFSEFKLVSFMPYTYTELDLGVSQDVLQGTPCETPFIPHISPNSVHS